MLWVFLSNDSIIEDLLYCALARSSASSSSALAFESVEDNSEHDLAGMAHKVDRLIVLILREVAFLVASPSFLDSSDGMLSTPGDFPVSDYAQPLQPLRSAKIGFQPLVLGSVTLK